MMEMQLKLICQQDKELGEAMALELQRQRTHIELIASENFVSPGVLAAAGSVLTNKYAEGYPGKRYYGGCRHVDTVEELAVNRLKELFGCEFANVQPHSGAQANYAAYMTLCEPGDTVLGMDLDAGGHLTHGMKINYSGRYYNIVSYGVGDDGLIDYEKVRELALTHRPKMIIAGASAYPRIIDFKRFADIAKECEAYLMVDMAHIAGLVAAGLHPSPIGLADVVTTTTHKTLRGPRGGAIMTNDPQLAKKINSAVFPGSQGGPLMHIIAAKAVAFGEALRPEFKEYQKQILINSDRLARGLIQRDIKLISGGTDNHLMLVDLREEGVSGAELEVRLDQVNITTNKNKIPNDPRGARETSGLRLGTAAVTTRGFKEPEMDKIAELIALAIRDFEGSRERIAEEALRLCEKYPLYN